MRIAQIAPLYESVPPRLYGGTERVVAHLSDELVRRGHEVTLFASGDSRCDAWLVPCRSKAIRLDDGLAWDVPAHLDMLCEVRERMDEFDILHFHTECWHLPLFADVADRTVTTLHGRLDVGDIEALFRRFPDYPVVSISDSQRRPLPFLRWAGTVYHGYPLNQYRFSPEASGGYLAFLGRISPEKGVDRAIDIARRAGLPLRIAAKVDGADRDYFSNHIAPLLDTPGVEFIGEIGEAEKSDFLGGAIGLLVPVTWPEPFGLVMIEAMACGTPVIAFPNGSVPEIIEHGVNGLLVQDNDAAVIAVGLLESIDRARVRQSFEQRFTVEAMVDGYEAIYRRILAEAEPDVEPLMAPVAIAAGAERAA